MGDDCRAAMVCSDYRKQRREQVEHEIVKESIIVLWLVSLVLTVYNYWVMLTQNDMQRMVPAICALFALVILSCLDVHLDK